jgi:prolyl-tRNA synthetase
LTKRKYIAVNKEVYNDEVLRELELDKKNLVEKKAIEVGNIFSLGTKFSTPFDLKYKNEKGEEKFVVMGSYGIGLGRLMGTIVEILSDEKGLVWPVRSPFQGANVEISSTNEKVKETSKKIYYLFRDNNLEVFNIMIEK